ncbi:MAG: CoA-binding protein [Proteobacteria bacterium]|nr:CoA-binding protein [Pseudomonadota bacterium]
MDVALEILKKYKRIAVVGLSPDPSRASYGVTQYMISAAYDIVGVRPKEKTILGRPCYSSLDEVPKPIEIVNIFRANEFVPEIVDEAIKVGAKAIWLQLGVFNDEAEKKAKDAGLLVVSDACILVEHRRLRAMGKL